MVQWKQKEVKYFNSWIQMENESLYVISLLTFRPLVQNIGLDDSGVHSVADPRLVDRLDPVFPGELRLPPQVEADARIMDNLRLIFARDPLSRIRRKLRDGLLPVPDPAGRRSS